MSLSLQPVAAQTCDNLSCRLLETSKRKLDGLVTLQCRIKRSERVNGAIEHGDIRVKVNTSPHKIYIYNVQPNEGTELLYVKGWNDDNIYIHPNQFPWINVSLSTDGSQMLKDQHHHVTSTGFVTVHRILKHLLAGHRAEDHDDIIYMGKEKWYGKDCDVVRILDPDYKITQYTVQPGEDLLKIDVKLGVPSYKLLELNPQCDDYFDVKAGQVIKVPTSYAKEIILVMDPVTNLPIVQLMYDDKGLFEKYEYSELKVNPRFSTMEFDEDNEAYGF